MKILGIKISKKQLKNILNQPEDKRLSMYMKYFNKQNKNVNLYLGMNELNKSLNTLRPIIDNLFKNNSK